MKAAELFVQCLENEGTPFIFGLPGEENMDLMDALLDSNLTFILTRSEQAAAFMADVQGRLTGTASVCLSTLGPGATNLVTGVADANMDKAPLVAITGQAGTDRLHKESHQVLDLVSLFRPITKYNAHILTPDIIPEVVRKAFKIAQTEKYGATHIDFPEDIAKMDVEGEPLIPQQPANAEPKAAKLRRAADCINRAKYPIILVGNGVLRDKASPALRRFVQKTGIPCANTFMAKGVLPYTDHHSLMVVGLQAYDYVNCGFDRADCVLTIGYDLVEYPPSKWNPNADKKIVHIDRTVAEVDKHYQLECGIEADITITLDELAEQVTPRNEKRYAAALRDGILKELDEISNDTSFPLKPQKILSEIRNVMGKEDILISDVGAHKIWIARMYPCHEPNTCIISNGFASMGIALPGSIGAKLRFPHLNVLSISGDGGFLMNAQELETAVRYNVPIVAMVWRDNTFGLIKWKQRELYGRDSHVDFSNPDIVAFAKSFGCEAYRIEAATELAPALREAFEQTKPVVIDCPVDYEENHHLMDRLGKLVCPI